MFHSNTARLIDYWRSLREGDAPPMRRTVDPGAFADLLPQVFILGREGPGRYRFRLSGGFVADLHGRELKGEQALPLWLARDRPRVQAALELCRGGGEPIVLNAAVLCAECEPVPMEVLAAPLAGAGGESDRYLGLYQPTALIRRLDEEAARELALGAVIGATSFTELDPRLRLAVIDGRHVA